MDQIQAQTIEAVGLFHPRETQDSTFGESLARKSSLQAVSDSNILLAVQVPNEY